MRISEASKTGVERERSLFKYAVAKECLFIAGPPEFQTLQFGIGQNIQLKHSKKKLTGFIQRPHHKPTFQKIFSEKH